LERCYILWMRFVRFYCERLVKHREYPDEGIVGIRKEYRTVSVSSIVELTIRNVPL
jgi:hypothetical protein